MQGGLLSLLLFLSDPAPATSLAADPDTVCASHDSLFSPLSDNSLQLIDSLIGFARTHEGIRYCYAGKNPRGFDCSGFMYYIFGHFGYRLAASSSGVAGQGREVSVEEARPGDIVYFKGRSLNGKRVGHVGMITEVRDGRIFFIHAAVKRGISYDVTDSRYYKPRFLGIRRIIE